MLLLPPNSKELKAEDITDALPKDAFFNEGYRAGIHINYITEYLAKRKFKGIVVGTGHSHPGNSFGDSEPTGPQVSNKADYNQILNKPHIATIVSKYRVALYSI